MNQLIKKKENKMKSVLINYIELKSKGFEDEPVTFIITKSTYLYAKDNKSPKTDVKANKSNFKDYTEIASNVYQLYSGNEVIGWKKEVCYQLTSTIKR